MRRILRAELMVFRVELEVGTSRERTRSKTLSIPFYNVSLHAGQLDVEVGLHGHSVANICTEGSQKAPTPSA